MTVRIPPMPRVAIITDSSADLPPELAALAGIVVVPVSVEPEFALEQSEPARVRPELVQAFTDAFTEGLRAADAIVAVLLSCRLGGVVLAADEARATRAAGENIEIIDSRSASLGLGFQAMRAAELAREGASARAIAGELRGASDRYHVVFLVESLGHLRQSGRIGRSAAMIAAALQLKPLLRVDEGQIVPYERVRTRMRAIAELAGFVSELPAIERCAVLYATSEPEARELADAIMAEHAVPPERLGVYPIGSTVAAHVGPGALGVAVVEADSA